MTTTDTATADSAPTGYDWTPFRIDPGTVDRETHEVIPPGWVVLGTAPEHDPRDAAEVILRVEWAYDTDGNDVTEALARLVADAMRAATGDPNQLSDGFHTFGELYEHRHALFCALVRLAPPLTVWRTWHHEDGSMFEGMFLAGIALPGGDISYHLPERYWDLLPGVRELDRAPHWDGYTPADVVNRLNAWRPWDAEQEGEDVLAETMMGGMGPDRTGAWTLNAHPPHDVVWAMAAALAESIGNAPNYQETGITFSPKPAGQARAEFALTVQRVDGKTPHQLRQAAEDRAAHFEVALQRILDTTGGQCETSTAGIGSCYHDGRTEDAKYLADRCCDACIAHRALTEATA
jgi:hypothetical protein